MYLPFAVWLSSNFGSIYVFSAWKEAITVALACLLVVPGLKLLRGLDKTTRYLLYVVFAYVLLSAIYAVRADSLFEFGAGFLLSTRFLLFFLVAIVLATFRKNLPQQVARIVTVLGIALAGFAVLQALILPPTLLQHIGYEPIGIETPGFPPSVTTLGEVDDFVRPQATLRGPNPLGAFLVLPFCLLVWRIFEDKRRDTKYRAAIGVVGIALLFTFSRSAWLATAIGTLGILTFIYRARLRSINKYWFIGALLAVFLLGVLALNTKTGRVIVLREQNDSSVRLSDDIRSTLTKQAWQDVRKHPFGRGPGNAGPVSVLDSKDVGRIAENYFLQVAQETGWLGLLLFIGIHTLLLASLWRMRANSYALVAFATLCGLIVANLTLHTWSDEAVSILWWSFAGSIIGTMGVGRLMSKKS